MPVLAQFNQDNFEATDQIRCLKIYVPDGEGYLPLLAGLLALPGNVLNYQEPESAQAEGVAAIWRDAYIQTDWEGCGTPPECDPVNTELNIWNRFMTVENGGAINAVIDAAELWNHYCVQATAAEGDRLATARYMAAGTWAYRYLCQVLPSGGINRLEIDPAEAVSFNAAVFDQYNSTFLRGQIKSGTFEMPVSGLTTIRLRIIENNPLSTGNVCRWTLLQLWRLT